MGIQEAFLRECVSDQGDKKPIYMPDDDAIAQALANVICDRAQREGIDIESAAELVFDDNKTYFEKGSVETNWIKADFSNVSFARVKALAVNRANAAEQHFIDNFLLSSKL